MGTNNRISGGVWPGWYGVLKSHCYWRNGSLCKKSAGFEEREREKEMRLQVVSTQWSTQMSYYKVCTWNLHNVINQCYPNKFNFKKRRGKRIFLQILSAVNWKKMHFIFIIFFSLAELGIVVKSSREAAFSSVWAQWFTHMLPPQCLSRITIQSLLFWKNQLTQKCLTV